jgi:hypothetical protein
MRKAILMDEYYSMELSEDSNATKSDEYVYNYSDPLEDASNPLYKIPTFLSYATPYNSLQQEFLNRVIGEIKDRLLFPRTLGRTDQYTQTPLTGIRRMMLSSFGFMTIAFRRVFVTEAISRLGTPQQQTFANFWLSSPYIQIETAMAYQRGLPIMILVEEGVSMNSVFGGVLELGAGPFTIIRFNPQDEQSISDFFNSVFWKETFEDWASEVRCYYDRLTSPVCGNNFC